jgi:hypothetical protein
MYVLKLGRSEKSCGRERGQGWFGPAGYIIRYLLGMVWIKYDFKL